jgi:hypothetical protein
MNIQIGNKQQLLVKQTIDKMPVSQSVNDFIADAIDHYAQHLKRNRYQIR